MDRKTGLTATALALLTSQSLADTAAGAQQEEGAVEAKAGYYVGSLRFLPKLLLSESYNDNIYATKSGKVSDYITLTQPSLDIRSDWEKHSVRLNFGAEIGTYWDAPEENYTDYWANAEGRYDLSPDTNVFGGLGYSNLHESRDSPDASLAGISPTTYQSHSAHLGFSHTIDRFTLRGGTTLEQLDFDNVPTITGGTLDNGDRDRRLSGAGLRVSYKLSDTSTLFTQLLYDKRDYRESTDANGYQRDSDGYRAAVGFKHSIADLGEVEAYVGLLTQAYDDARFDDVSKSDFSGKLMLRPTAHSKLTAKLDRGLYETTQNGSAGYLYTSISGRYEYYFTSRLTGYVSASYGNADYLDISREDDNLSAGFGIKYQISPQFYVSADYLWVERDSNDKTLGGSLLLGSNDFEQSLFFLRLGMSPYPQERQAAGGSDVEGEFELGAIYVGEDSLYYGNYTGLNEEGFKSIVNIDATANLSEEERVRLKVDNAGLDSRTALLSWSRRGKYDVYTSWDELPSYEYPAQIVYSGSGTSNLSLPSDWFASTPPPINSTQDMDQLAASLHTEDIGTKRKQLELGGDFWIDSNWQLLTSYRNVTKEGLSVIAGPIGTSPGNTRVALLAEPVGWNDHQIDLALGYSADAGRFDIKYHASIFQNSFESLGWESPFSDAGSARYSDGRLALSPDNQFHQISLSGNYLLSRATRTRLSAVYAYGLMLQDEDFLPYTINPGGAGNSLPANSLDGRVVVQNANVRLVSQPHKDLRLDASYRFSDRDNQTDQLSFDYITADSNPSSTTTVVNQPYGYQKHDINLDAKYRLHPKADFIAGYDYERMQRHNSERDHTSEDTYRAKLQLRPTTQLQTGISLAHSTRDGSDYEPAGEENPLLRKYNLADRDRDTAAISISYQPKETVSVSASLARSRDDYTDTEIGLRNSDSDNFNLDTSVQLSKDLSAHAFYSWERIRSDQAGSETPIDPDWKAEYDDRIYSIGLGLKKANAFTPKLDISLDYVYSNGKGSVDLNAPGSLVPVNDFPDLSTKVHTLKLTADYRVKSHTSVRVGYQYEKYSSDDWAVDGVYPDSLQNVLTIGAEAPNYNQHLFWASVIHKF